MSHLSTLEPITQEGIHSLYSGGECRTYRLRSLVDYVHELDRLQCAGTGFEIDDSPVEVRLSEKSARLLDLARVECEHRAEALRWLYAPKSPTAPELPPLDRTNWLTPFLAPVDVSEIGRIGRIGPIGQDSDDDPWAGDIGCGHGVRDEFGGCPRCDETNFQNQQVMS
jgi:hypothetical protein